MVDDSLRSTVAGFVLDPVFLDVHAHRSVGLPADLALPSAAMDCPSCGTFVSRLSKVCPKCKAVLEAPAALAAEAQPTPRREEESAANDPRSEQKKSVEKQRVVVPPSRRTPLVTSALVVVALLSSSVAFWNLVVTLTSTIDPKRAGGWRIVDGIIAAFNPALPIYRGFVLAHGIAFLFWAHGTWRDLRAMFPEKTLAFTPGSAVAGFFIPLVNLVHPYRLFKGLIAATSADVLPPVPVHEETVDPQAFDYRESPQPSVVENRVPTVLLRVWLIAWILQVFVSLSLVASRSIPMIVASNLATLVQTALFLVMVLGCEARLGEIHRRVVYAATRRILPLENDTLRPVVLCAAVGLTLAFDARRLLGAASVERPLPASSNAFLIGMGVLGAGLVVFVWTRRAALAQRMHSVRMPGLVGLLGAGVVTLVGQAGIGLVVLSQIHDAQRGGELALKIQKNTNEKVDQIGESSTVADVDLLFDSSTSALQKLREEHPDERIDECLCIVRWEKDFLSSTYVFKQTMSDLPGYRVEDTTRSISPQAHRAWFESASKTTEIALAAIHRNALDTMGTCMQERGVRKLLIDADKAALEKTSPKSMFVTLGNFLSVFQAVVARDQAILDHGHFRIGAGTLVFDGGPPSGFQALDEKLLETFRDAMRADASLYGQQDHATVSMKEARVSTPNRFQGFTPTGTLQTLPAPPDGLSWTTYRGDLGRMDALITSKPARKYASSALLWVPGYNLERDSRLASQLASEGRLVMLPMVRGMMTNPGLNELNFGEIDDLSAALDAFSKRPEASMAKVLVVGDEMGGARALLLAEQAPTQWGLIARNPILETDWLKQRAPAMTERDVALRSPLYFLPSLHTTTYLLSELGEIKASDGAARSIENEKTPLHSIGCTSQTCSDERFLALLRSKLDSSGDLSLRQEAPNGVLIATETTKVGENKK